MKQFDAQQQVAIQAQDGHFLVLAPPGCGKTDILAERIAVANERGMDFSDMLCLTFTNRASRGMRDRIEQRVQVDTSNLFVGNIHRFCSNYLFQNHLVPASASIIDESDQTDILLSYDSRLFLNSKGQINKTVIKEVSDLAAYIMQTQLGHPEASKFTTPYIQQLYSIAKRCRFCIDDIPAEHTRLRYALLYQDYKKQRNYVDFSDILILAYDHLLKNPNHKRYPWVQIDEVQDLNSLQMAILDELILQESPTVMYLGDEQQAIFSFLGAELKQLELLKERCADNILTLNNNYRAPEYLLHVCNTYAETELGVSPALLPNATDHRLPDKMNLILAESSDTAEEEKRIHKMLNYYLGLSDKERVAILVPTNDTADRISNILNREGISHFKISGTDMFKTTSFKTVASFYEVLVNEFSSMAWSRLLYGINALSTPAAARNFLAALRKLMMTPRDLLETESRLSRFIYIYQNQEMVFFDTETTGLNVLEDDIVQIAAFKVFKGEKVVGSEFNLLLHTDREIPTMLGDKQNPLVSEYAHRPHTSRAEGLQQFLDYIGGCPVLGHNVTYDYLILKNNVERELHLSFNLDTYDSLRLIKLVEPHLHMYKLEYLLKELGLEGENSHLADEDIAATKSLVDYCVAKALPLLPEQQQFRQRTKVKNIAKSMAMLQPMFNQVCQYLHLPLSATGNSLSTELKSTYSTFLQQQIINDLGNKFDVFLQFVKSEWENTETKESLSDQLLAHVKDMTSSLSEGDLVNSTDLISDRVFIMTIYKGKGLEFDNVIILGANDGTYPFYYSTTRILEAPARYPAERVARARRDLHEDARKFYVALSRAKRRLCVSYSLVGPQGFSTRLTPFMDSIRHLFYTGRKH